MTGPTPSRFDGRAELREAVHEEHEEFYDLREGGVSLTREVRETLHAEESECQRLVAQLSQKSKECEAMQTLLRAREVEVAQMEAKLEANNAKWEGEKEGRDLKAQVSRQAEQIEKLESQLKCKDNTIALLVEGAGKAQQTPVWLAVACFVAMLACWALWSGPSEVAPRELSGSHAEYFSALMAARGIISSQGAPPLADTVGKKSIWGLSRVLVDVVRLSVLPLALYLRSDSSMFRVKRLCYTNIIFCAGDFLFEVFVRYDQWQYPWLVVAVKAIGHFLAYLIFFAPTKSLVEDLPWLIRDGLSSVLLVSCFLYTLDTLWWVASQGGVW